MGGSIPWLRQPGDEASAPPRDAILGWVARWLLERGSTHQGTPATEFTLVDILGRLSAIRTAEALHSSFFFVLRKVVRCILDELALLHMQVNFGDPQSAMGAEVFEGSTRHAPANQTLQALTKQMQRLACPYTKTLQSCTATWHERLSPACLDRAHRVFWAGKRAFSGEQEKHGLSNRQNIHTSVACVW